VKSPSWWSDLTADLAEESKEEPKGDWWADLKQTLEEVEEA